MDLPARAFSEARSTLKTQQRAWALRAGHELDKDGYCLSDDDNIFGGLSASACRDFERGDGTELSTPTRRGKIRAVHSSSALACNVFDHWRKTDGDVLVTALRLPTTFGRLKQLEGKFSTGLRGKAANLDVVLTTPRGEIHAIESKFCETYSRSTAKTALKPKYFEGGIERWTEAGLPGCQAVAESLRRGDHDFHVLDVAQLLKHMLALARNSPVWSLGCLWFDAGEVVAQRHRYELDLFRQLVGTPDFYALTYQELCARFLPGLGQPDAAYVAYLSDRYGFGASATAP